MLSLADIRVGDSLPERSHAPDTVQLFLFNAAIWNAHRIHYDQQYTTREEGYPGIVVDGPLQADWLTQTVVEWIGDAAELVRFEFRNRTAAYAGESLTSIGRVSAVDRVSGEVRLELGIRNAEGQIITPGSAVVRFRPESPAPATG